MLQQNRQASDFQVSCLGPFRLVEVKSGVDKTPASRKTRALLGYLAVCGKAIVRERLASLLWGDRGDEQARASLRQALYELRSVPGSGQLLRAERDTVSIGDRVTTDISAIIEASAASDLEALSSLLADWRGDLLEDLPSIDPSFDGWLQGERLRVHDTLIDAAMAAAKSGMKHGHIDPARRVANLLQQRDSTNEMVLRLCLTLDRMAGDTVALHRRYERFRDLLKSELGASPASETQQLFQQLIAAPPPLLTYTEPAKERAAEPDSANTMTGGQQHRVAPSAPSDILRAPDAVHNQPLRDTRVWGAAILALVILCVAGWAILHRNSTSHEAPMLAVMAFQDLSDNTNALSFSERMALDIAQGLVRRKIQVAAMPSEVNMINSAAPKPLAITHVLSGSVENIRGQTHVIAQLMDIRGDRVVWSHSYDGDGSAKTPSVQISAQIVDSVGKLLTSNDLNNASNVNAAAYARYTKGLDLYRQRDWHGAETALQESVRTAPNFAQAWSALAAAHWREAVTTLSNQRGAYKPAMAQSARAAADRALALNPQDGQAMGVLALLIPPAQLIEIDRQLEKALRVSPHNPQLLEWHGRFLMFVGRNHDALDKLTRAYELDNSMPSATSNLVIACLKTGHFDVAKEILSRGDVRNDSLARDIAARLRVKYFLYVRDWFRLADYLRTLPGGLSPQTTALLGLMHETAIALSTRETEKYDGLKAKWRNEASVDLDDATQMLFALGDTDGAFDVIETAIRSRQNDPLLSVAPWEPLFDPNLVPLRRDPRLPALLVKWNLLKYWQTTNHWPDFTR